MTFVTLQPVPRILLYDQNTAMSKLFHFNMHSPKETKPIYSAIFFLRKNCKSKLELLTNLNVVNTRLIQAKL